MRWYLPAALGAGVIGWFTTERPADFATFARAGQALLDGRLGAVYAGDADQAGPLQHLIGRLLAVGGSGAGPARPTVIAVDVLLALLVAGYARRRATRAGAALAIGALAAWLAAPAFWGGHPVEILVPLLWLVATKAAGGGAPRTGRAALALAAAALIAPWGLLGLPCVLRRDRWRRSLVPAAAAAGLAAAVYAPLLLAGRAGAVHHAWPVSRTSLLHLLLPDVAHVGWGYRLGQAAVVVTVGAVLALRLPAGPVRGPVLVVTTAALRIATDPLTFDYYWIPAGVGAIALLITLPQLRSRAGVLVLVVAYLTWAADPLHLGPAAAIVALATAVAAGLTERSYSQSRSSSWRNRAAGSAVLGPSR